jgi:hypothetical protein
MSAESNHAVQTTARSGPAIRFGNHGRAAPDERRSPVMRAERGKLKSRREDLKVALGKRGTSAALGKRHEMIPSPFSTLIWRAPWRAKSEWKKERGVWWRFTQGGGLPPSSDFGEAGDGLALIPYPKLFIAERSVPGKRSAARL